VRTNVAERVPLLASVIVTSPIATVGVASLSTTVATPVLSAIVAFTAPLSLT
jgi:hypothetical protein